jgi:hypothetical protein
MVRNVDKVPITCGFESELFDIISPAGTFNKVVAFVMAEAATQSFDSSVDTI